MDDKKLDEIISLLRAILEVNKNLYNVMSKYDVEYLTEVERDGFAKEG